MLLRPQLLDFPPLEQVIHHSPLTATPDLPVSAAIAQMHQHGSRCLLVVVADKLLGIFTRGDVMRLLASGTDLTQTPLTAGMTRSVITLTAASTQTVLTAFSLMQQHQIHYLPVLDAQQSLIGLVTQADLIQVLDPLTLATQIKIWQQQEPGETMTVPPINLALRGWCELAQDFCDHDQLVALLQTQVYRWQALFDRALDAIAIADDHGRYIDVNPAACKLFGVSRDQLLGSSGADFADPDLDFSQTWHQFLQTGEMSGEFCLHRPDDSLCWVEFAAVANYLPGRHLSILRDITAEKECRQAEMALRESQRRLATLINNLPGYVYRVANDPNYTPEFISEGVFSITGHRQEDYLVHRTITCGQEMHPEDTDRIWNLVQQAVAAHQPYECEYRIVTKAGTQKWVWERGQGIYDADGNLCCLEGFVTDISGRKHAEETLRASEQRYHQILDSIADMVFVKGTDSRLVWGNKAFRDYYGMTLEAMQGIIDAPFNEPDYTRQYLQDDALVFETGQTLEIAEEGVTRHDGVVRTFSTIKAPIYDENGQVVMLVGVGRDISDRKATELALRESEHRYASLAEAVPVAIFRFNALGECIYVNERWSQITGRPAAAAMGMGWLQTVHPENRDQIQGALQQYLATWEAGEPLRGEGRTVRPDGKTVWYYYLLSPEVDTNGTLIGFAGSLTDISDRKQAEFELREREEFLRSIYKGAEQAVFVIDVSADGEFRYPSFNRVAERYAGVTQKQIQSKTPEEAFGSVLGSVIRQNYALCLQTGTSISYEEELVFEDHLIWTLTTLSPLRNRQGRIYRIVGTAIDITDRKQGEQKIREQAALLDITSDAIAVRDMDNRIQFWNRGAERLYGWTTQEAIGLNLQELLGEASPSPLVEAAIHTSGEWQGELEQVTKTGRKMIVISRWSLVRNEAGEPKFILVVNTDITEKKQLEAQLLHVQRLESLGTLAGGIAHDLNNLLTPILLSSQLLKKHFPAAQPHELLDILETNAKRGANLVRQILTFARNTASESKHRALQLEPLLLEVTQICQHTFPKAIALSLEVTQPLHIVSGDATQLHQVLMNLCVNARDAMPGGGEIKLSAANFEVDEIYARMNLEAQVGSYVVITVADTGTGISSKSLEKIFDPFFTTKPLGQGTGLGLSVVQGIVSSHGGFIRVISQVGQGSQFKVFLPAVLETVEQSVTNSQLPIGHGELILVVEDEPLLLTLTKMILEDHNYQVLTATNGIEAIALYAEHCHEIAVVLMDMMMPEMGGQTAILTLQKLNPQVQIIACSGLPSSLLNIQVRACLPKPFTAQELLNTLHELL